MRIASSKGSALVLAVIASAVLGIIIVSLTSQMGNSRNSLATLRKEAVFLDLVGQVQKATTSIALCGASSIVTGGVTPAPGQAVTFGGPSLLNLANGLPFQNNQITIREIKWSALPLDVVSPSHWVGYLVVSADLGGSVLGGKIRTFPRATDDPRSGIKVDLNMLPGPNTVVSCGAGAASTQFFKYTFPASTQNDLGQMNGVQNLPLPFVDANYSLTCSVMNPWSATLHGGGANTIGWISVYNYTSTSFNWHYFQRFGDFIPIGFNITANCVAFHP